MKDTSELVETTREEVAKAEGVHDPTRRYDPRLIAVGEGWVLRGLDEALAPANVGDKLQVEVPPEKGFGTRDPSRVRMIPLRKFGEKADELSVGDEVEVDNRTGIVRSIGSGRAQIDFNHRYAGKTLAYDVEIVKRLDTEEEKMVALIRRRLPVDADKLKLNRADSMLDIELPADLYLLEGLQIIKRAISSDLFKYLTALERIRFVESYEGPKQPAATPPTAQEQKPPSPATSATPATAATPPTPSG